jgi:hypothetical protein
MAAELGGRDSFERAAKLVRQAIEILDASDAPGDIAAHLDLAAARIDDLAAMPAADHARVADSAKQGQTEPN